jgi:hypothetical protein
VRAVHGVYIYNYSKHKGARTLEDIAQALRRSSYNYISYESALSAYGAVSQVPMGWLTVATTGREGVFATPWGTIEFTHTKRNPMEIISETVEWPGHTLPIAKAHYAYINQ